MANSIYTAPGVEAGQAILIEGELKYSRLREKVPNTNGDRPSKFPADVYRITLENPRLADVKKWGLKDNGGDTPLAKAVFTEGLNQAVYKTKDGALRWSFDSKGNVPQIIDLSSPTKDAGPADQILEKELATDQTVVVAFSVFFSKTFNRLGGSLDAVGIEDANHPKYFTSGSDYASLFGANQGTLKPKVSPETADDQTSDSTSTPEQTSTDASQIQFEDIFSDDE